MLRGCCDVTVEAAMKPSFAQARPEEPLDQALCKLDDDGILLVLDDNGRLLGIVTGDIVAKIACRGVTGVKVGDVMNRSPLTLKPGMRLDRVLPIMMIAGVKAAPVVDQDGVVLGIVTLPLIAKALNEEIDVEELPSAG